MPWPEGEPAIILVDLDAFFASVEQMDHPEWKGKPVIVGGTPEERGVVSTASYEAREYGVHSAMPSAQAVRLCPDAIWTPGNYKRYGEVSAQVMAVIESFTPFLEQVSVDEAFADITPSTAFPAQPLEVAAEIQRRIFDLGVTCSIGLATSKSLAKIASEVDKPRGLTAVYPGTELSFVDNLSVRAMSGIGPSTERRLNQAGFMTLGDVFRADLPSLANLLGKTGETIYARIHGLEQVSYEYAEQKSVSHDVTFATDIADYAIAEQEMLAILAECTRRLRKMGKYAKTLSVKVHYDYANAKSAQMQVSPASHDEHALKAPACELLQSLWVDLPVRLISVGLDKLVDEPNGQDALFADENAARNAHTEALVNAQDAINQRFGKNAVMAGRSRFGLTADMFTREKD